MDVPAWLVTARDLRGTKEAPGTIDNPTIMSWPGAIAKRWPEFSAYARDYVHDEIAWCGLFVAYCLSANGIRPVNEFLWARNWANFGTRLSEPKLGCVMVFARDGGGHVAFYEGEDGGNYRVTGGNQSDSVSTASYPKSRLIAAVWPPQAERLPTVSNIPEWSQGKGSWYSQLPPRWVDEGDRPNSNALGVPDSEQGIALYSRATLGKYFDVVTPDGRMFPRERQTDIGPHPNTGRSIDISAALADRMGYTPHNFPTDSIFKWRPTVADQITSPAPAPTPLPPVDYAAMFRGLGALLGLLRVAFPQVAVFGTLAQFMMAAGGFMGTPIGEAATTTGQVTGATMLSLLASWAVSKINKVAK